MALTARVRGVAGSGRVTGSRRSTAPSRSRRSRRVRRRTSRACGRRRRPATRLRTSWRSTGCRAELLELGEAYAMRSSSVEGEVDAGELIAETDEPVDADPDTMEGALGDA